MRLCLVLLVAGLVACGTPDDRDGAGCPTSLADGAACGFEGRCWRANDFSSCLSEWCTCEEGQVTCEAIAPQAGDACGDEPISQCSYEGNPGCTTLPTAASCACTAVGTWQCDCACYGGQTTCTVDPCTLPPERLRERACGDLGLVCSYPGGASCTCDGAPDGPGTFVCD